MTLISGYDIYWLIPHKKLEEEITVGIKDLSAHLFWDVDREQVDIIVSKKLIIQRVLELGTLEDWKVLVQMYGLKGIDEVAIRLRSLDDKTVSFLCTTFNRKKEDFRCYRLKQSAPNFWSY